MMALPNTTHAWYNLELDDEIGRIDLAAALQPSRPHRSLGCSEKVLAPWPEHRVVRGKATSAIEAGSGEYAHTMPDAMPERLVLFQWGVSSYFGWGVYGLNMMLAWAGRTDFIPASLQPVDPASLDLDPLEWQQLAPAMKRSAQVQEGLLYLAGRRVHTAHTVLSVLKNELAPDDPAPHGVELIGRSQIGVAFLEAAVAGPGSAERLRPYRFVVAGSSWNRDLLQEAGAPAVELVLQGVDPSHFHPAPRRALFADRFVVFSGGKLEFRKGQDLVLLAFRAFAERHPDALLMTAWASPWPGLARSLDGCPGVAPLLFRGDGTADVMAWAGANGVAAHQVLDLGSVPNRAMPRILREADVALFPSRAEGGTNLVAMESMACGVPTIVSANTGHLDLVAGGGCIPLWQQRPMAEAGCRDWGVSSIDEMVAALETIYRDREAAAAVGYKGAAFMAGLSWTAQMGKLASLLQPFTG